MKKTNKHFRTTFIILIIFISFLALFIPLTPAAPIDKFFSYSIIQIDYDEEAASESLLPIDMTKEINVTLNYFVDGIYDEIIPPHYEGKGNFVYLYIINKPEWCIATISPNFLKLPGTAEGIFENVTLTLKIDEKAHALLYGTIGLKIEVQNTGPVKGGVFYSNISFNPGYLPLLKINVPNETIKQIGPLESTRFEIEVENLGNAKTLVLSKPIDIPDGWNVAIDVETVIGTSTSGDNPKKTISVVIQPPIDFGYHDEREIINISIIPSFFNDPSVSGQEYLVSFLIQSKGISTPGFEIPLILFSIIFIVLILNKRKANQGTNQIKKRGGNTR